jgi:sulfatase modifying factor 1
VKQRVWLTLGLAAACTQPKPDADPPESITIEPARDASAPAEPEEPPFTPAPPDAASLEPPAPPTPQHGPSCSLDPICGPASDGVATSCCETRWVPGGVLQFGFSEAELADVAAIDRVLADRDQPIGVSGFFLDRFEISVGRFLTYARQYEGTPLPPGAGAHPLIEGSGWQGGDWDNELAANIDELLEGASCGAASDPLALLDRLVPQAEGESATPEARLFRIGLDTLAGLDQPMACLSWFRAQAFCIWDRGRLPTEAEWELAAAGGGENRAFPWGDDASLTELLAMPGSIGGRPEARGRYGQDDLAGGLREWTFDGFSEQYRAPEGAGRECTDCANLDDPIGRVVRGGDDSSCCTGFVAQYRSASRETSASGRPVPTIGARCARDATDPTSAADQTAVSRGASGAGFPPRWFPAN